MPSIMITLVTSLAVLATTAIATPIAPAQITGSMLWQGMSNGKNVTLSGTATEILSQLQAADEKWTPGPEYKKMELGHPHAAKRNEIGPLNCCPVAGESWKPVDSEYVQIAMDHLNQIGGTCGQAARSCAPAMSQDGNSACDNLAGIHICNDNYNTVWMPCTTVAWYALQILKQCPGQQFTGDVCGQGFDDGAGYTGGPFNIVVSQC